MMVPMRILKLSQRHRQTRKKFQRGRSNYTGLKRSSLSGMKMCLMIITTLMIRSRNMNKSRLFTEKKIKREKNIIKRKKKRKNH